MAPRNDVLAGIRSSVDASLDEAIGRPDAVGLLMFPFDGNVGNHMMWLAITDYLRDRGIRVAFAAHASNVDLPALGRAVGTNPVLFLGGVTLSPLWPDHLSVKRSVAEQFPQNRLVQLTSTTLFDREDDRTAVREVFARHPDVTILVRDPTSAEQLTEVFGTRVRIRLAHDTALRLRPPRPDVVADGVGWLVRRDAESAGAAMAEVASFDWPEIWDPVHRRTYLELRASGLLARARRSALVTGTGARVLNAGIAAAYGRASRRLVDHGVTSIGSHHVLVTDRMHPHVLAALIGTPVVLLPDRFGKNRFVYEHTTSGLDGVYWADDVATADEIARSLLDPSCDREGVG